MQRTGAALSTLLLVRRDMSRRPNITLLFSLLGLTATGCAHRSTVVSSPQPSDARVIALEKMQAETERAFESETERAFELETQADLVIDYESLDRIRLRTPDKTGHINATEDTLAAAMASATPKRELAVVIVGK